MSKTIKIPATNKQRALLLRKGYTNSELKDLTVGEACRLIDELKRNNWTRPSAAQIKAREAAKLYRLRKSIIAKSGQ